VTTRAGPFGAAEIIAALKAVHAESERYWDSMSTPTFLAPIGRSWSPADNVRHLTKSMRAVTTGLRLPRWMLWLAFRRATRSSRDYETMREVYRTRLAKGADAGRFAPEQRGVPADAEAERRRIMEYHRVAVDEMARQVSRWPDGALDRRQLPHPLLGALTVREMLLFTLYHNRHHFEGVQRRLGAGEGEVQ
jgi:hypothetical protein